MSIVAVLTNQRPVLPRTHPRQLLPGDVLLQRGAEVRHLVRGHRARRVPADRGQRLPELPLLHQSEAGIEVT